MKIINKFKWLAVLVFLTVNTQLIFAQTKDEIFDTKTPITWLGVDYSLTRFIGSATISNASAPISNDEFRDTYVSAWNYLFINEEKKYDVAKAVHRESVKYAIDVTLKSNKNLTQKNFFTNDPKNFKTINADTIANAVKNYNFLGNEGIGMMFFVEGMSKGEESEGIWVTFVDMKTNTVLFTTYKTGKPGGFGFRNYWAKPLYTVLKDMDDDFKNWNKK